MSLKVWKKYEHHGITYYTLLHPPYKHEVFQKDTLSPEAIQEIYSRKGYANKDWGKFIDVQFQTDKVDDSEAVELPPGSYYLKPHDGLPTRLEVMNTRDEGYTPLDDHTSLVKDIGRFLESQKLYERLQFLYRRGYLLYGEPGTGKTAFIRHLAQQKLFKSSHVIWAPFVPPSDVSEALNRMPTLKVLVMEELIEENGHLAYDMQRLLDFMDGERSIKNCIIIGTTNYPEFLHKNLADRPSRFDVLFEMKSQPKKVILSVLEKWLERPIKEDELDYNNTSLAHLKEIVLLHNFHGVSLKEAAAMLKTQSKKFEKGFSTKADMGMGLGKVDL